MVRVVKVKRKYLRVEEAAIDAAKLAYIDALMKLQEECEHNVILEHEDTNYEKFRVCEGCGATCRAPWGSEYRAFGNMAIFSGRAYQVDWPTFAKTAPAVGGWCQTRDEPTKFRRGGKKDA
jgi:hypothetical protein